MTAPTSPAPRETDRCADCGAHGFLDEMYVRAGETFCQKCARAADVLRLRLGELSDTARDQSLRVHESDAAPSLSAESVARVLAGLWKESERTGWGGWNYRQAAFEDAARTISPAVRAAFEREVAASERSR